MSKGRVLVDMDGVLADFEAEMERRWRGLWPDDAIEHYLERTTFRYSSSVTEIDGMSAKFNQVWSTDGFFESMPEIPDAIEALRQLNGMYDVRIVTSASAQIKAFSEKATWIQSRLGDDWVRRLVITHRKHFIMGDVLIDDRPDAAKGMKPPWQQIIYDQPYNQHVDDCPRISWSDDGWLETIEQTVAQVQANR